MALSPPCFSAAAGGMGSVAKDVYKRIVSMMADKQKKSYSRTINWLRYRLSFSLPLRSAVICLRGSLLWTNTAVSIDSPRVQILINALSNGLCVLAAGRSRRLQE